MIPYERIRRNSIFICILGFSICFQALAQEKLEIKADIIRGMESARGPVRILEGNVHLRQGTANLFCDYAEWYANLHETILEKNVRFDDGSKTMTANKVHYYDLSHVVHAEGDVVLVDSMQTMKAEQVTYKEIEEHIIAENKVELTDQQNEVVLTGTHSEYLLQKGYAFIVGGPELIKKDSTGNTEIRVIAGKIELFNSGDRIVISDSVHITHSNGQATCDHAEYFKKDNRLVLKESPVVWQRHDRMSGHEIELFFRKKELQRVVIHEQALVSSPVDTTRLDGQMNRLLGDRITLMIDDNGLNEVLVEGKATSYYHILEDGDYKGMNKIIGDVITMQLANGKIQNITINSDPGKSTGIFYPPEVEIKSE